MAVATQLMWKLEAHNRRKRGLLPSLPSLPVQCENNELMIILNQILLLSNISPRKKPCKIAQGGQQERQNIIPSGAAEKIPGECILGSLLIIPMLSLMGRFLHGCLHFLEIGIHGRWWKWTAKATEEHVASRAAYGLNTSDIRHDPGAERSVE